MARAHNWAGRTRLLRPEIYRDDRIIDLAPVDRLLFIGLLVFSNAAGAIPACPVSIQKAVFPCRPDADINAGLCAIERTGLIRRCGDQYQIASIATFVQAKKEVRHHASEAKRRAAKRNALPAWADRDAIRSIYEEAKAKIKATGQSWHVDHIIPLSGKFVCGLHVPANLRIIPGADNLRKSNKYEVEA